MNKLNGKKILITGSQGFIGSHLVSELSTKNRIIGLNSVIDQRKKNYTPIKKDIVKLTPNEISGNLDGIIHLAAITDVDYCNKNPQKCFKTNILGTQNALDVARKKDCKFVFLSTSHVYGNPIKIPIKEDNPTNPTSIYSASKLAGEACCKGYAESYGMDISIIRLFSVYGPRSPPHLVTSRIISQLGEKSINLGNLNTKRDFIYISDVIRAIKIIFKKSNKLNVYNVGFGRTHSILDVCKILERIVGRNLQIKSIKPVQRKNDVIEMKSDITEIKKIGWIPTVNLKEGLRRYYNWYLKN